jgi:hypothetical protein
MADSDFPNGRGRGVAANARRHPLADRPAAGTTRASMTSAGPNASGNQRERYALIEANRARFSIGALQPEASIALCLRRRRFAVARAGERREAGRKNCCYLANAG